MSTRGWGFGDKDTKPQMAVSAGLVTRLWSKCEVTEQLGRNPRARIVLHRHEHSVPLLSTCRPLFDSLCQFTHLLVTSLVFLHVVPDLPRRMNHSGVVAAPEPFSDLRQGEIG